VTASNGYRPHKAAPTLTRAVRVVGSVLGVPGRLCQMRDALSLYPMLKGGRTVAFNIGKLEKRRGGGSFKRVASTGYRPAREKKSEASLRHRSRQSVLPLQAPDQALAQRQYIENEHNMHVAQKICVKQLLMYACRVLIIDWSWSPSCWCTYA
jgi:hypothetical protein